MRRWSLWCGPPDAVRLASGAGNLFAGDITHPWLAAPLALGTYTSGPHPFFQGRLGQFDGRCSGRGRADFGGDHTSGYCRVAYGRFECLAANRMRGAPVCRPNHGERGETVVMERVLDGFIAPSSIAVVGASNDLIKPGGKIVENFAGQGHHRAADRERYLEQFFPSSNSFSSRSSFWISSARASASSIPWIVSVCGGEGVTIGSASGTRPTSGLIAETQCGNNRFSWACS